MIKEKLEKQFKSLGCVSDKLCNHHDLETFNQKNKG